MPVITDEPNLETTVEEQEQPDLEADSSDKQQPPLKGFSRLRHWWYRTAWTEE